MAVDQVTRVLRQTEREREKAFSRRRREREDLRGKKKAVRDCKKREREREKCTSLDPLPRGEKWPAGMGSTELCNPPAT